MSDTSAEPRLWSRILAGARWTLLLRVFTRSLGVIATLFVARLVPQAQLGGFGAILIADQGLQALTALGMGPALVQMKKDPVPYLHTAWTAQLARALVLYAIEFVAAPFWCRYFHAPEAVVAMRILGLSQVVLGLQSMGMAVLTRDLRFDRLFYPYALEAVAQASVTILIAYYRGDIWAPVLGLLAGYTMRAAATFWIAPVPMRLGFDREKFREMFAFTKWLAGYSAADFALETIDNAVTGRVLGRTSLAQYRMAYQLATEGPLSLQWIIARVAFPTFAKIQRDPHQVVQKFRAALGLVTATMIPLAAGIAAFGGMLVPLLLGPTWTPAARPLRILAFGALLRATIDTAPPVLRALGHTRTDFILKMAQVVPLCAALYPAVRYHGTTGVATAVTGAAIIGAAVWVMVLRSVLGLRAGDFLVPVVAPLVATMAALATTLVWPVGVLGWPQFIGHGLLFAVVYAAVSAALLRPLRRSGLGAVIAESKV
jgi:O-antigen/teichoic acid export membrane protein